DGHPDVQQHSRAKPGPVDAERARSSLTGYFRRDIVAVSMGGTLMNRIVQLTSAVLFLGLMAACDQKGPLRVDRVDPGEGISGGGDSVSIVGSGFEPGKTQAEVRFGRRRSESVVI